MLPQRIRRAGERLGPRQDLWYYLDPATGVVATSWVRTATTWVLPQSHHRQDDDGVAQNSGAWYCLKTGSGAMATGRLRIFWTWYL